MAEHEEPRLAKKMKPHPWTGFDSNTGQKSSVIAKCFLAAIAVAFLGFLGWGLHRRSTSVASAESLLAHAYSERRVIEIRVPGARYSVMHLERSAGPSSVNRPQSLIEAELLIARMLKHYPADVRWLQAKARDQLLNGNYEASIRSLRQALESEPESPELLADLAAGYFERAQADERPDDYGSAIELLGKAIAKSREDQVAVYNRALACEKLLLNTQAVADWKHYLEMDADSGWADEARQHLAEVQAKIRLLDQRLAEPLDTPSAFAGMRVEDANVSGAMEERVEEYLHTAVVDWLPAAYPQHGSGAADAKRAVQVLARWTKRQHRDEWLSDLLSSRSDSRFPQAILNLSRTLQANEEGNTAAAQQHALAAVRAFASSHNVAGVLRARLEYLFAKHLSQNGYGCLRAAAGLSPLLEKQKYPWMQIQSHLEEGTCLWLDGNLGSARRRYQSASDKAESSRYQALYLRSQDHLANLEGNTGDLRASWATAHRALQRFWSGRYPAMRGYNLYYDLQEDARIKRQPRLQMAIWRAGLELSESFKNKALRATAHSMMGDAANSAGESEYAAHEYEKARDLLSQAPQDRLTRMAILEAETRLGEVDNASGHSGNAVARLAKLEPEIADVSDTFLSVPFYAALGEAELSLNDQAKAERFLLSAVGLAELNLRSFLDEKTRLEVSYSCGRAYRNLVHLKLHQGDFVRALEIWEWYRGSSLRTWETQRYRAGKDASKPANAEAVLPVAELHEVQSNLSALADETVLSYARLEDGFVLWLFDNRGVSEYRLTTPPRDLEALASKFHRLCSDPGSALLEVKQNAQLLYESLIAPIESKLSRERTLVIEADGFLVGVPFDALLDKHGHYLSERVTLASSLGFYYRDRQRASVPITAASRALVAAVSSPKTEPYQGQAFLPLPDAVREAETVAGKFRSPQFLTDHAATLAAVRLGLGKADVFHFAGHAVTSARQSGLLLSDDILVAGVLTPSRLSHLQLVVLSACDTLGETDGLDYDPDSLVRLFASAGVTHIVASRWNVDSAATRKFMQRFYEDLLAGNTVSAAINRTENFMRTNPGLDHPYFWSGFMLFGLRWKSFNGEN